MLAGARLLVSSRTRTHTRTRTRTHTPRYPDATDDQSDGDDADAIPTAERIKPIVVTWSHASEAILLVVLGVAEWQRRSRRCTSDPTTYIHAAVFSLVLLFLASLTGVVADGVEDKGASGRSQFRRVVVASAHSYERSQGKRRVSGVTASLGRWHV